jgi:1,4-dihydroxy-2-naphthoate octaprenyltransferase
MRSSFNPINLLFLVVTPIFWIIGRAVTNLPSEALDPWLKKMALSSVLFVLLFGLGLIWPLF